VPWEKRDNLAISIEEKLKIFANDRLRQT